MPKPANALKFVVCVTATGTPDCERDDRAWPSSRCERPDHAARMVRAAGAERQIPDDRRHEDVRDVARRIVALERAVEAVGDRIVRDRARQDRRVEHRRGVVHQLGTRVG